MNGFNSQKYLIFAAIQKRSCVRRLADRLSSDELKKNNGPVAEWLGSALQKLLQRFESARDLKGCHKWQPFLLLNVNSFAVQATQ